MNHLLLTVKSVPFPSQNIRIYRKKMSGNKGYFNIRCPLSKDLGKDIVSSVVSFR